VWVAGQQAGEPVLRHRGAQVVADGLLVVKELGGDHSSAGVQAAILRPGRAAAVAPNALLLLATSWCSAGHGASWAQGLSE
jgi:hypothetical protein